MPVYEFICVRCSKPFEELVLGPEEIRCPKCSSLKVEKRYSTFATSNTLRADGSPTSNEMGSGACGACGDPRGPGSCSLN